MNEAERTDTQALISAALDYIERMETVWEVDRDESDDLRGRIADMFRHIYETTA